MTGRTKSYSHAVELLNRSKTFIRDNNIQEALATGLQSIEILSKYGPGKELAEALVNIGHLYYSLGRLTEALDVFHRCSVMYRGLDDINATAHAQMSLGKVYRRLSNYRQAIQELRESYLTFQKIDDQRGMGANRHVMGLSYFELGNYEIALENYHESIEHLSVEPVDKRLLSQTLVSAGNVFRHARDYERAMTFYQRSLKIASKNLRGAIYGSMGNLCFEQKDHNGALKYYKLAHRYLATSPSIYAKANTILNIGSVYGAMGKWPIAIKYLKRSCAQFEMSEDKYNFASSLTVLALTYVDADRTDKALPLLHRALSIATEITSQQRLAEVHSGFYDYYIKLRDYENALKHIELSRSIRDQLAGSEKQKAIEVLKIRFEMEQELREEEMRQRNDVIQAVINAQEIERQRIARDLHDGVGQMLAAVGINLARLHEMIDRHNLADNDVAIQVPLKRAMGILGRAGDDVRALSHALGSSTVRELGLVAALGELLANVEAQEKTSFEFMTVGMEQRMLEAVEIGLFRVAQELIANVLRHSGASEATVQIMHAEQEIRLTVEDNGIGFDVNAVNGGMGHRNVAARVAAMRGRLYYDSTPGHGTTVTVVVGESSQS